MYYQFQAGKIGILVKGMEHVVRNMVAHTHTHKSKWESLSWSLPPPLRTTAPA